MNFSAIAAVYKSASYCVRSFCPDKHNKVGNGAHTYAELVVLLTLLCPKLHKPGPKKEDKPAAPVPGEKPKEAPVTGPAAKGPAGTAISQVLDERLTPPDEKAKRDVPSPEEREAFFILLHPAYLEKSKYNTISVDTRSEDYIERELPDGKYTAREMECADGYILDTAPKTFYVEYGGCTTITWPNTAVRGQIQIVKKSADYNSTNGLPAGTLLEGATFEICNERTGNKVDTIVTGPNGLASSKQLPLGRYTIREIKAPANYGVSTETYTAVLEFSGQIVKLEVSNKSMSTGVSITKTGPKEAMSGQPVRYVFSRIGNSSNVMLQSFYWRDTLPAAVRLTSVVTGTYNFPGTYKIVYKVNNTGDYRTLADSLSTSQNYTLAASPVALGLAANERVTEIMFVFGQVPGGFSQVEAPMLHCTAVSGLAAGSSFANVADVGGTYNGVWVQAVSRWVTTVYGKKVPAPKLPRTGY